MNAGLLQMAVFITLREATCSSSAGDPVMNTGTLVLQIQGVLETSSRLLARKQFRECRLSYLNCVEEILEATGPKASSAAGAATNELIFARGRLMRARLEAEQLPNVDENERARALRRGFDDVLSHYLDGDYGLTLNKDRKPFAVGDAFPVGAKKISEVFAAFGDEGSSGLTGGEVPADSRGEVSEKKRVRTDGDGEQVDRDAEHEHSIGAVNLKPGSLVGGPQKDLAFFRGSVSKDESRFPGFVFFRWRLPEPGLDLRKFNGFTVLARGSSGNLSSAATSDAEGIGPLPAPTGLHQPGAIGPLPAPTGLHQHSRFFFTIRDAHCLRRRACYFLHTLEVWNEPDFSKRMPRAWTVRPCSSQGVGGGEEAAAAQLGAKRMYFRDFHGPQTLGKPSAMTGEGWLMDLTLVKEIGFLALRPDIVGDFGIYVKEIGLF